MSDPYDDFDRYEYEEALDEWLEGKREYEDWMADFEWKDGFVPLRFPEAEDY